MTAVLPRQGFVAAVLASVAGVAVWGLAGTPFGLLAPVSAMFLFLNGRLVVASLGALAIAAVASGSVAWSHSGGPGGVSGLIAAFSATALCIGAVVFAGRSGAGRSGAGKAGKADASPADTPGVHRNEEAGSGGSTPMTRLHPDDRPAAAHATARAFWTGVPQVMRYRHLQPDGSYRWSATRSSPEHAAGVDIDALSTGMEQPTTSAAASRSASDSDAIQAAKVIESLFGNAWAFAADGSWIYLPLFAQTTLGLTPESLNAAMADGRVAWHALLHPDDYDRFVSAWRHCLRTGEPFHAEHRIRRATGRYAWARSAARPVYGSDGAVCGWFGTSIDLDVHKKTVEALQDRERELTHLVNMVPSYLWRLTADGEPSYFNRRLADFFGMDVADLGEAGADRLSRLMETLVHPDDAGRLYGSIRHCVATGEPFRLRYRLRRSDGAFRWVEGRAEPLRDRDGRILQWYGLSNDVDDQLRAEEALRESERSLRQLVETLPALIYCAAPDGRPTYRSRQLRDFLGFGLDEIDEPDTPRRIRTLEVIIHPDDHQGVVEAYGRSLATGEPYARKHRLRRFDGAYRWVETRAAAMRNAEGAIVQWNGVCFDIEDQVRAREELRLAQEKLAQASQAASLAELSASIAHEVNQPLAAIVANSHACQRWLTADPPNIERAQKTVERVIRDANAAADIVSRIRALFRHDVETKSCAALHGIVGDARDLLAEEAARRRVRILVDVEGELPPSVLDPVQVQQVLVNLMRNGMEAMESAAGEKTLRIRLRRVGDAIRTEITDCGPGIDSPDRIFEPFFTTKGHGMGMGLAICRSIVAAHGGRLWAENREGGGAAFMFTLPVEATVAA